MISCLIIDDEENGRGNLSLLVKKHCPQLEIVGMAESVKRAIELVHKHQPQLLLLDIEMKDGKPRKPQPSWGGKTSQFRLYSCSQGI
jgi:two-component system LytT family response regulator